MNEKNVLIQTLSAYDLPEGWTLSTLGEISTKPQYGWTTKANHESGKVKLLRTTDITSGKIDWITVPYCTKEPEDLKKYLLKPGDIVISRAGSVGVSYLLTDADNAVFASYLIRFRPNEPLNKKYVYYYLKSPDYWKAIGKSTLGIAVPNVNAIKLSKVKIPIAPVEEQKRIVAEIEKQFSRLDEAVENLKRVKANLKRYKASVLKAAVEGKLIDITEGSESFHFDKWQTIGSALLTLDQGWSPKCDRQKANESEWGVIKTSAVQTLQFIDYENKRLPKSLEGRQHLELQRNDLLVTRAGPRKRVGVCCLVRDTRSKLILCDKVYRLRCNPEVVRSGYLELVLNAPQIQKAINEIKTGISDSGVNLTQKGFKKLKIPLPRLELQVQIESEVQRLWSIADRVALNTTEGNVRCQRLRQSILKKAFSGRLFDKKYNNDETNN